MRVIGQPVDKAILSASRPKWGSYWLGMLGGMLLCVLVMPLSARSSPLSSTLPPALNLLVQQAVPQAQLKGVSRFRYFGFHVYDAQLWVSQAGGATQDVTAQPFALSLQYARAFKGADIAARSVKEMQHIGQGSTAQLRQWQAWMAQYFPDVSPGDRLTGIYLPGQGTRFYLQDKWLADMPDEAFASAFFGIWLHEKTSEPALRAALLALPSGSP